MKNTIRWFYLAAVATLVLSAPSARAEGPTFFGANNHTLSNLGPPNANALPVPGTFGGALFEGNWRVAGSSAEVEQEKEKAVFEWDSFDIGENASVHFNQQGNAEWVALNRIYDANPSRVFGKLSADGRIYLINQNGILFGETAQINVHSLVASSLNISDDDFLSDSLSFRMETYREDKLGLDVPEDYDPTLVMVRNTGAIEAREGGAIFLMAPNVDNQGLLYVPAGGQVGLIGGHEVGLKKTAGDYSREFYYVTLSGGNYGKARNAETGVMIADNGLAGMYGGDVLQNGIIRSVTAINKGGAIELHAANSITTGAGSITICPLSISDETLLGDEVNRGRIVLRGIDPEPNLATIDPAKTIGHHGIMSAPFGEVEMRASEWISLESGSLIDVAGARIDLGAAALMQEAQLNTMELRDTYGQKGGLLQGETISVARYVGSSFGDLTGALTSEQRTILEQSIDGGVIRLVSHDPNTGEKGPVIIRQGAVVDFSGGGIHYAEGQLETTKLRSGDRVYDISEAPEWIDYDGILGLHATYHERYGVEDVFEGLFGGGANEIRDYMPELTRGGDAGTLHLVGSRIIIEGTLIGGIDPGFYQEEVSETEEERKLAEAMGIERPKGGTVVVGAKDGETAYLDTQFPDYVVDEVVLARSPAALPEGFAPGDPIPDQDPSKYTDAGGRQMNKTYLPLEILNEADLSNLEIYANIQVTSEKGSKLSLNARNYEDGLKVRARRIEHHGEFEIPGGKADLEIRGTITDPKGVVEDRKVPDLQRRIYLAEGSRISVAGRRIDNTLSGDIEGAPIQFGPIDGGQVRLAKGEGFELIDQNEGIIFRQGSRVDVSGGYEIHEDGTVTGGNAGSVEMVADAVILEGDLKGHSLPGNEGGTIRLHALEVSVAEESDDRPKLPQGFSPEDEIPEDMRKLVFTNRLLEKSGFTHVELDSYQGIELTSTADLSPSTMKLAPPEPARHSATHKPVSNMVYSAVGEGGDNLLDVPLHGLEGSSFTFKAGLDKQNRLEISQLDDQAVISMAPNARIATSPKGTVVMEGPGLEIGGTIDAPAGEVDLEAWAWDLALKNGTSINVAGYNKPLEEALFEGWPTASQPLEGGTVRLSAFNTAPTEQSLLVEDGVVIDISGSKPVADYLLPFQGAPQSIQVASAPGRLEIYYKNNLTLDGEIRANAYLDGLHGAALSYNRRLEGGGLTLTPSLIQKFMDAGFDDMQFGSWGPISLDGSMDFVFARKFALDAPEIRALNPDDAFRFRAPWIALGYTGGHPNDLSQIPENAAAGSAVIDIRAGWIDLEGSTVLSGFKEVFLHARKDIRLQDVFYNEGSWEGGFKSSGDITLKASRMYPTTMSDFTIRADAFQDSLFQDRKITILPAEDPYMGTVLSAGGKLTLEAMDIEQRGVVTAPLGRILFQGPDRGTGPVKAHRIMLARGSLTTTRGDVPVKYGDLNDETWTHISKTGVGSTPIDIQSPPEKYVEVSRAEEAFIQEGAEIDVSGGGMLFSYEFLPSIDGSTNPLENRYIVLPVDQATAPGEALYIPSGFGVPEGVYSLFTEAGNPGLAFLPDAVVLQEIDMDVPLGEVPVSREGFPIVRGYDTYQGTDFQSPKERTFWVLPAEEILGRGRFNIAEMDTGAAGDVKISANSTVLDGKVTMEAMPWFSGGVFHLDAENIIVGTHNSRLPEGFDFNTTLPSGLEKKLHIDPEYFKGMDVEEIRLGEVLVKNPGSGSPTYKGITRTVILERGQSLEAPVVALSALDAVTLEPTAEIHALDPSPSLEFFSYRYRYDPDIGLGFIKPMAIEQVDRPWEGVWTDWSGLFEVMTEQGPVQVSLFTSGLESQWDEASLEVLKTMDPDKISFPKSNYIEGSVVKHEWGEAILNTPTGTLTIDADHEGPALVHALDNISLKMHELIFKGDLKTEHSFVELGGAVVYILPEGYDSLPYLPSDGFSITPSLWKRFSDLENIQLTSDSDLVFLGDADLFVPGTLTIDAGRVAAGLDNPDPDKAVSSETALGMTAGRIRMINTGAQGAKQSPDKLGFLSIDADRVEIGPTADETKIILDGFKAIEVTSKDPLAFRGQGVLEVDLPEDGAVHFYAPAITSTHGITNDGTYQAGSFVLQSGAGTIVTHPYGTVSSLTEPGGILEIITPRLAHHGVFDIPGGTLVIKAQGGVAPPEILLHDQSRILLKGGSHEYKIAGESFEYNYDGGLAELQTEQGSIRVQTGAMIDVGATSGQDAGAVSIYSPNNEIALEGEILGSVQGGGKGGSFFLDTLSYGFDPAEQTNDFDGLGQKLAAGGFDNEIAVRLRKGDVTIPQKADSPSVKAESFKLVADGWDPVNGVENGGNITVEGTINVSGPDHGGTAELYAGKRLFMDGGTIHAKGTDPGAAGGDVVLSSQGDQGIDLSDAEIDVSGGTGGEGGKVHFRAQRVDSDGNGSDDDVRITESSSSQDPSIKGSSKTQVEAYKVYEDSSISTSDINTWKSETHTFMTNAPVIENRLAGLSSGPDTLHVVPGLEVQSSGDMSLAADPYGANAWDLTDWRYGGQTGVLTLRAGGNLNISKGIVDKPTASLNYNNASKTVWALADERQDSWAISIISGSDLSSPYPMSLRSQPFDLTIDDSTYTKSVVVFSESGPINFASSGDALIGASHFLSPFFPYMIHQFSRFAIGSYDGDITGLAAGSLVLEGGTKGGGLQTATGDIDLRVRQDVILDIENGAAIRSTGDVPLVGSSSYSRPAFVNATSGGNIRLEIGGSLLSGVLTNGDPDTGQLNASAWDMWVSNIPGMDDGWSPGSTAFDFNKMDTAGIATLGGGNILLKARENVYSQIGTFNKGNLTVISGADIDGRFLVKDGTGVMRAGGNIGVDPNGYLSISGAYKTPLEAIELFDAQMDVTALGAIEMGAIYNPTLAQRPDDFIFTYTENTSIRLAALGGDFSLFGSTRFREITKEAYRMRFLPQHFEVWSKGNIGFRNSPFIVSPSQTAQLTLMADEDIHASYQGVEGPLRGKILVSDIAPEAVYDHFPKPKAVIDSSEIEYSFRGSSAGNDLGDERLHGFPSGKSEIEKYFDYTRMYRAMMEKDMELITSEEDKAFFRSLENEIAKPSAFSGDEDPVRIKAGKSIRDMQLFSSKQAEVIAGDDIKNIWFVGQHISDANTTRLSAGRNIKLSEGIDVDPVKSGIQLGGPGYLLVGAGANVDLGTTRGIQTIGGDYNYKLGFDGASVILVAGYHFEETPADDFQEEVGFPERVELLFKDLRETGILYSEAMAQGEKEEAYSIIEDTRGEIIEPFFENTTSTGEGNVYMVKSRIFTNQGGNIYTLVKGDMDIGTSVIEEKTSSSDDEGTGIMAMAEGSINTFLYGDLNVNESRMMALMGGDIMVWSDRGNINAGKGSKSAITPPAREEIVEIVDGEKVIIGYRYRPPLVGSGLRCLTYDPDGVEGPVSAPEIGDIYLFAPEGVIDAGEAGIAGKNLFLGATEVLNAQNIEAVGVSVGVPLSNQGAGNLGALTGAGGLNESDKLAEKTQQLAADKQREAQEQAKLAEGLVPKFLEVRVISFDEVWDDEDKDKKKKN